MKYSLKAQFIKTPGGNKNLCIAKLGVPAEGVHECISIALLVGESGCSLNLSETGTCLKSGSKSPDVPTPGKVPSPHVAKPFNRDTEKVLRT